MRSLKVEHYRLSTFWKGEQVGLHVLGKCFHNHDFSQILVSEKDIAETALSIIHEVENSPTFQKPSKLPESAALKGHCTCHVSLDEDVQEVEQVPTATHMRKAPEKPSSSRKLKNNEPLKTTGKTSRGKKNSTPLLLKKKPSLQEEHMQSVTPPQQCTREQE